MRKIFKVALPWSGGPPEPMAVQLPQGALVRQFDVLLSGQIQAPNYHPTIWVEAETDNPPEPRHFILYATDDTLRGPGAYLGSYQEYHLYEPLAKPWLDWEGGDGAPDGTYGQNVDIIPPAGPDGDALAGCDAPRWTGPAAAADWSAPCRYRISDEQPDA